MSQIENLSPNNSDISTKVSEPTNEVLKHLFLTKKWCDLTITFGSKSFSVHRNIICSTLPYFDTMMSNESRQDHVTLNPPIDIEAFECLIKWAYSIKINIDLTNVHSLLVASDYFHVTQVYRDCCEYLESVLNNETALKIKGIIEDLEVGKLASKVSVLIMENFTIISKTKEWFELPIKLLTKYLEDGDAVGFDENEIIDAIIRWAEYKPESRQKHLSSLLKLVNWKFVDSKIMVEKIASHDLVKSNESCRKLLIEVFKFMGFQSTESSLASYWKSPRIHKYNGEVIMAFVELPGKLQCLVQLPYSKQWKQWMTLDMDLSGEFKVAATDEYLYIYSKKISVLIHLPTKTYQKTISVYVQSVTASSKEVFITKSSGIRHSSDIIKSIQYSPFDHKKCNLSTMCDDIFGYEFVYLNNALYFFGGKERTRENSNKLQKYDISQSKWTLLTPMYTHRSEPHVVALDGKIYVIGGMRYDGYKFKSAEYYDPNLDKWFNMPFPGNENDVAFLIAYCSKLYAFMDKNLKIVHIYDPKTGKWEEGSKVPSCQDVLSVISIPNLTSLTFD